MWWHAPTALLCLVSTSRVGSHRTHLAPPSARAAAPRRAAALRACTRLSDGGLEVDVTPSVLALPTEDTRPATLALLDSIAALLVDADADGKLRAIQDEQYVDALLDALKRGRAQELPLLAQSRLGSLLTPRYLSLMRERLRAAEASTDPAAERGALLVLNEFVLSVANSTQSALGTLHSRQMDKVAALCTAAQRGGTPALHAAAYELFERGGLDADFVNWLALAIDAADAADGELPSQWQLVLRLIRQGTHAILQADYTQDIEVLRHVMSIPPAGRKDLLWTSLQEMNGESARHFEVTLRRIVGSLGLERDDKARVLHAEASELLVATEEWFDSPFYDGS